MAPTEKIVDGAEMADRLKVGIQWSKGRIFGVRCEK